MDSLFPGTASGVVQRSKVGIFSERMVRALGRSELTRGLYPIRAGAFAKPERHVVERRNYPESVLLFCASGRGMVQVGRERYPVRTSDVAVMPAGRHHVYYPEHDGAWTIYWVHYVGDHAARYERAFRERWRSWKTTAPSGGLLLGTLNRLIELDGEPQRSMNYVHAAKLFECLLAQLAFRYDRPPRNAAGLTVEAVDRFLREQIDRPLTLDALAGRFSLSKYHFGRWFKRETGVSPMRYFHELKMRHAAELLATTSHGVAEVAYAMHFEDPFYFSRLFRKLTGYSPTAYRELIRADWGEPPVN